MPRFIDIDQTLSSSAATTARAALNASIDLEVVVPEQFGAIGDGTTDDGAALVAMFETYATANGGACIHIPAGKIYATSTAFEVQSNTHVFGGGTIKCTANTPGGRGAIVLMVDGVHDIIWDGPTIDGNGTTNANCIGIGALDDSDPFQSDIYINCTVKGARIDTALEDSNNILYSGGGKGFSVQGRTKNLYAKIRAEDCDIAATMEANYTSDRELYNNVLDVYSLNSHRTALLLLGTTPRGYGSSISASYQHSLYPGCTIKLHAQGGQDSAITNITTEVEGPNYDLAGVITSIGGTGVYVDAYIAASERCTLIRGKMFASCVRINAYLDHLQDVWNPASIAGSPSTFTNQYDNVVEANVHAATHSGVVVRTPDSGAVRRSKLDVSMWCENGVSDITSSGFGTSVTYRFVDMASNPVKEVTGISSSSASPTWALNAYGGRVPRIGTMTTNSNPTINTDLYDQFHITAQGSGIVSMTTNLSGTPVDGQRLRIRIKGTASRAITWGASFTGTLLSTTSGTNTHVQDLMYDSVAAKWVGTYADTTGY